MPILLPSFWCLLLEENLPKIRDLVLFQRFYGLLLGGLTGEEAARQIGIDKSVLYRKLDEIERFIAEKGRGLRLVDRASGKASQPTEEGTRFYARVGKLLDLYRETVALPSGERVTIGATNFCITYLLPILFEQSRFLEKHLEIEIHIEEGEWWEILNRLHAEEIDFGIGPVAPLDPEHEVDHLMTLRRGLLHNVHHPRFSKHKHGSSFDIDELAAETLFLVPQRVQPDFPMESLLPPPTGGGRRIVLPHYSAMKEWVRRGMGVAIVHEIQLLPSDKEFFSWIDLTEHLGVTPVDFYYRPGKKGSLSKEALSLVESIETAVKEGLPGLGQAASGKPMAAVREQKQATNPRKKQR